MTTRTDNSREVRVFVSSTFVDLFREREYLVKMVFPEIRHICRERGIVFTEIDLRWGLTHEDASFGRVISTCLQEIERCRPFFIGLLGDRYGWVPSFSDIHKSAYLMEEHAWLEEAVLDGASLVDMEFQYAVLGSNVPMPGAFFYVRKSALDSSRSEEITTVKGAVELAELAASPKLDAQKLVKLRERVQKSERPAREFTSPEELGKLVRKDLLRAIKELWPEEAEATPLMQERRRHEAFAMTRRQAYIARQETIRALSEHVMGSAQPLIVFGESGIGKSALLAYWSRFFEKRNPDITFVTHFVGSVSTDTGPQGLLRRLLGELKDLLQIPDELPTTPAEMQQTLVNWLARVPDQKLVIIIDALDQLDPFAAELTWLPDFIPTNVRVIVSTTPGKELDLLRKRGWSEMEVLPFTTEDREALITRFLSEYRKSLTLEQAHRIATNEKCASPLFLRTILEELRLFGNFEQIDARIDYYLASNDIDDLFQRVLERMEEDFGKTTIREIMTLLWSSREGLTEHELLALAPLTRAQLSRTLFALEYQLTERHGLIGFFHDHLRRAVERHYLSDTSTKLASHERLAEYFAEQPDTTRKAYEYPWQLRLAEDWASLKDWLTNIPAFLKYCTEEAQWDYIGFWLALKEKYEIAPAYAEALAQYSKRVGNKMEYAHALDKVGKFLRSAGEYAASEQLLKEALSIVEATLGADHPETADALSILGNVMLERAEYRLAAPILQRALSIYETSFPDSEKLATSLDSLAILHYSLGEYDKAETLLRHALDIDERKLGHEHPKTLSVLGNLAVMVMFSPDKRLDEAEEMYRLQLAGLKSLFGTENTEYAAALSNLAGTLRTRDDYKIADGSRLTEGYRDAVQLFSEALDINERLLGPDHPTTGISLQNLAGTFMRLGEFETASALDRRSLAIVSKVHGDAHPETARHRLNVAGNESERFAFDTAEAMIEESLNTFHSVFGPEHADTIRAQLFKANLYRRRGLFEEVDSKQKHELLTRALSSYEALLPKLEHVEHIFIDKKQTYERYLEVLKRLGETERAEEIQHRILNMSSP
jgi:tetratricopeptide (TPR) repeat protein